MSTYSFCRNDMDQDIVFNDRCDSTCDQNTCTYNTIYHDGYYTWKNQNGYSKTLNANQNYPIRIIRNSFSDLNSTDFYLLTTANLISIIPNTETFYLNNPNGGRNSYVPSYVYSQLLTNNFASIDKGNNNYGCDAGDFVSSFRVNTQNDVISLTC